MKQEMLDNLKLATREAFALYLLKKKIRHFANFRGKCVSLQRDK